MAAGDILHILYVVHDLSDPAVRRRTTMLKAGGANVSLAGFRRTAAPVASIEGIVPIDLGVTRDGRFDQRLLAVARASLAAKRLFGKVHEPDVIIARNLEMLTIARRAKSALGWAAPVVYECLDIHRLVLRDDIVGSALRASERALGRGVSLLMTSSPAFVANYFARFGQVSAPIELVENRFLELGKGYTVAGPLAADRPWRIGWFGALRCRKSLELLAAFTRQHAGRYEVVLRGRPALSEFPDFHGFVDAEPYLSFEGEYRNPEDIARIYGDVHFAWAIDFFEEGQNSKWLLPNRLYEGCRFAAVPITMAGTETSKLARERGVGLELRDASVVAMTEALDAVDATSYGAMKQRLLAGGPATWSYGLADCRALVGKLAALASPHRRPLAAAS